MASLRTKKRIKRICAELNIRVTFYPMAKVGGWSYPWESRINVCPGFEDKWSLSIALHEIAHCLNYRNRKYFKYHRANTSKKYLLKMALRAEVYTDKVASKLGKTYGIRYLSAYKFNNYWRNYFREYYK